MRQIRVGCFDRGCVVLFRPKYVTLGLTGLLNPLWASEGKIDDKT